MASNCRILMRRDQDAPSNTRFVTVLVIAHFGLQEIVIKPLSRDYQTPADSQSSWID